MKTIKNNGEIEVWDKFIHDGNLDALSQIYFHYYDLLFNYGLKHTTDKQVVEDAIQNVFINLIKLRKSIGDVKNVSGYLMSTFRRQLLSDQNKQKKIILTEEIPEVRFDFFRSPDQDISEKEDMEQLHLTIKKCIGHLTAKQQEIIFLRFESEISYEEIAKMLNISVDSCYKSVYRTLRVIRKDVEGILGKGGNVILWFWSRLAN